MEIFICMPIVMFIMFMEARPMTLQLPLVHIRCFAAILNTHKAHGGSPHDVAAEAQYFIHIRCYAAMLDVPMKLLEARPMILHLRLINYTHKVINKEQITNQTH